MKYNTNPRIALVIPRINFVYRGGGATAKGILNWAERNNYCVDVISDQPYRPNDMFNSYFGRFKWIYSSEFKVDPIHRDLNLYDSVIDTEMITRLKNSLVKAIEQYSYGAIITNLQESLMATTSIGLHKTGTVCHITHSETEAGLTGDNLKYHKHAPGIGEVWQSQCGLPGVRLLVQSDWLRPYTVDFYKGKDWNDIETFPLLLPDAGDKAIPKQERYGIGTIGSFEPRKANDVFIDYCKEMNETARLLAPTKNSAEKFMKKCAEKGVKSHAEYGLGGYEKRRWLASLGLAYHPSHCESFALGALETAEFVPTILRKDREWSVAHEKYCHIIDESELVSIGKKLYNTDNSPEHTKAWQERNDKVEKQWHSLVRKSDNKINANWKKMLDEKGILNVSDLGKIDRRHAAITQDTTVKMAKLARNQDIEQLNTPNDQWVRYKGSNVEPQETVNKGSFESLFEQS